MYVLVMFHSRYLDQVQHFGMFSNETAVGRAKGDVYSIIRSAIDKTYDVDLRDDDELDRALIYCVSTLGVARGYVNAFREALNLPDPEQRKYQLVCCYNQIIKHG